MRFAAACWATPGFSSQRNSQYSILSDVNVELHRVSEVNMLDSSLLHQSNVSSCSGQCTIASMDCCVMSAPLI
ncbi:hypothetical protein BCR42DRAFT_427951 [Absidia repens]|uniref:Uncharacterized protein n=1 Tax=Absidia repens TaxID=90262 RepID=A0A1X2HYT1_9FUNG|nr:hypothetical protein BCR42DRAFT_427951 [Absidia repens]